MNPDPSTTRGVPGVLRCGISQYVGRGEYSGFVDGKNELGMSNALSIFELAKLEKAADLQSVLLLTLMYRLMQFITNPATRTQRKYLILDEVWALLKHDSAAAFLEEAARALARVPVLRDLHEPANERFQIGGGTGDQEQLRE